MSTFLSNEVPKPPRRSKRRHALRRIKERVKHYLSLGLHPRCKLHVEESQEHLVGRIASVHFCHEHRKRGCCENLRKMKGPKHSERRAREIGTDWRFGGIEFSI
jgi:hypothetical protein